MYDVAIETARGFARHADGTAGPLDGADVHADVYWPDEARPGRRADARARDDRRPHGVRFRRYRPDCGGPRSSSMVRTSAFGSAPSGGTKPVQRMWPVIPAPATTTHIVSRVDPIAVHADYPAAALAFGGSDSRELEGRARVSRCRSVASRARRHDGPPHAFPSGDACTHRRRHDARRRRAQARLPARICDALRTRSRGRLGSTTTDRSARTRSCSATVASRRSRRRNGRRDETRCAARGVLARAAARGRCVRVVRGIAAEAPAHVVQRPLQRRVLGEPLVVARAARGEAPRSLPLPPLRRARAEASRAVRTSHSGRVPRGDARLAQDEADGAPGGQPHRAVPRKASRPRLRAPPRQLGDALPAVPQSAHVVASASARRVRLCRALYRCDRLAVSDRAADVRHERVFFG